MKPLPDNCIILYSSSLDDNENDKYYSTKIKDKKEINRLQNQIDDIKKNVDKIPTLIKDIDEMKEMIKNILNQQNQQNQLNQQQKTNQK